MAEQASVVTTVEGPKGTAEVVEVFREGSNSPVYEVRFGGKVSVFVSEGEASIEAMLAVGNSF